MLPDLSGALAEWAQPIIVKTVTKATVDFEPIDQVAVRTVQAVVQPAQKRKLNPDIIDWSLKYLQVHSVSQIAVGEFIEYKGEDYKIVDDGDYDDYGFYEVIAEQTKRTPLVETFTLAYSAGGGGSITGTAFQVVQSGTDGTAVTATPATGYTFDAWSDGVLTASRTDLNVATDVAVTATFAAVAP
jgi:hypothetical protein